MNASVTRVAQRHMNKQAGMEGLDVINALILQGPSTFPRAFKAIKLGDEQAAELFYQVYKELAERLNLKPGDQEGLQRFLQVIANAQQWDTGLLRNNIFKAANAMGIPLPSHAF